MNDIFIRLRGSGNTARGKISAPGADSIPKWSCICTLSADMNKLGEMPVVRKRRKEDFHEIVY